MKRMKKSLVVLLAVSMLLSMASVAMAADGDEVYSLEDGGAVTFTLAPQGDEDGRDEQCVYIDNTVSNDITVMSPNASDSWAIQYGMANYAYFYERDSEGKLTFEVAKKGWLYIIVRNWSDHEITLTISTEKGEASDEPTGTIDDPFQLNLLANDDDSYSAYEYSDPVEQGSEGLYYTFVAPVDGLVVFEPSYLPETWNWDTESWEYIGIQFWVEKINDLILIQSDRVTSLDPDNVGKITMEANEGDKILLYINTFDEKNPSEAPAADCLQFNVGVYPEGTSKNPEVVGAGPHTFNTGSHTYKFIATEEGTLTVTVSSSEDQGWYCNIDVNGNTYSSNASGSPYNSTSVEVTCKEDDEIVVYAAAPYGAEGDADASMTVTFTFASDSENEETPDPDEESPATDPNEETPDGSDSEEELPATDDEEESPATDDEEELPATDAEEESNSTGTGSVVTTGDSSPIVPFMVLAVVSAAVALGAIVLKKKVA